MAIRVGLIGYGTIGSYVARAIHEGRAGDATLVAVLDMEADKFGEDAALYPWKFTCESAEFFDREMDLVVETAGHGAVRRYAAESLRRGKDFLTIGIGAFTDDELLAQVKEAALASGRKVLIPSGALGGLDAIAAAAIGGLDEVTITTSKPPNRWIGTAAEQMVDLSGVTERTRVFSGTARESARLWPHNTNIHASVSLAGIGLDRTRAEVYADPSLSNNTQEISARGYFGEIRVSITSLPLGNRTGTGRLVALSVIKAIRNLTSPFLVGL